MMTLSISTKKSSSGLHRAAIACAAAALALTLGAGAGWAQSGDTITVGLFAPTTPIGGPSQRLELVNRLAAHLSSATGKNVTGRSYSKASAFTSAAKRGDIHFAVVDAPYAAARRLPYRILAAASRNGRSTASWQLVATSGVTTLADLEKKQVAVPRVGSKDSTFVANVLLEGEVDAKYFRKIETAPNPNAAATMVSLGRVQAALVPEGTSLPGGVSKVLTLRSVGLPMFVALKGADDAVAQEMASAVRGYAGSGVIAGFAAPGEGNYRRLRAQFGRSKRDGVMSVPKPARLAVRGILADRKFEIVPSDIRSTIAGPALAKPAAPDAAPARKKPAARKKPSAKK